MQNVSMKVTGKKLIIEVDLTKNFGPSKSGRTQMVASTQGNQSVPGDDNIKVGLNVYKPI